LAHAYRGLGNVYAELEAYRKAIDSQADYIDAWLHLGAAYLKVRRGPGAEGVYIDANGRFQPKDPEHFFFFALAQLSMEMVSQATEMFQELQKLAPEYPGVQELKSYLDDAPSMVTRIRQALKKTWNNLNPGGRNPLILPDLETMCSIESYGDDDEATRVYLAMPDEQKWKLVQSIFPVD
jgi:tetratricopeptide (TPR) repeat protein